MSTPGIRSIIVCAIVLAVAIQLVPIGRDNPPVTASLTAPAPVMSILRRSCFDCHSHDTRWPWYSYAAPASWLVAWDVHEGRRHLNLSAWSEYAPDIRLSQTASVSDVEGERVSEKRPYVEPRGHTPLMSAIVPTRARRARKTGGWE